jgi:hypothetical protein
MPHSLNLPEKGSYWRHYNGGIYQVEDIMLSASPSRAGEWPKGFILYTDAHDFQKINADNDHSLICTTPEMVFRKPIHEWYGLIGRGFQGRFEPWAPPEMKTDAEWKIQRLQADIAGCDQRILKFCRRILELTSKTYGEKARVYTCLSILNDYARSEMRQQEELIAARKVVDKK